MKKSQKVLKLKVKQPTKPVTPDKVGWNWNKIWRTVKNKMVESFKFKSDRVGVHRKCPPLLSLDNG
jgi:hypothetical protein